MSTPLRLAQDGSLQRCKTPGEIEAMREAGHAVAVTLSTLEQAIIAGERSTLTLDLLAAETLHGLGAVAAFKGYQPPFHDEPYPYHTCISVNNEIVHGMPGADKMLREGDIVSLDLGAAMDGWFGDGAITVGVGKIDTAAYNLLNVTRQALKEGIKAAKPGKTVGDIGAAIATYIQRHRYHLCQELTGHGIGRTVHEEPSVPNVGIPGKGERLEVGMTLCIEPMVAIGTGRVASRPGDVWTVFTADGSLAAHFEHTIAITSSGAEILTQVKKD